MFARLVLVAFFLICCTPGCHGEGEDDDCVDYEYESPDYGGECTLDLLGDFQEMNDIGSKECCVGGMHLHDTSHEGFSKMCGDKGNETHGRFVCAGSENHAVTPGAPLVQECNEPCHLLLLGKDDVNKTIEVFETADGTPITDHCRAYICDHGEVAWTVKTLACICESVEDVNAKMNANLTRCCDAREKMLFNKSGNALGCDGEQNDTTTNISCHHPGRWRKHDWKHDEVEINETSGQVTFGSTEEAKSLEKGEYCVGAILDGGRLRPTFMDCHTPCGGNTPCLRSCCDPGKATNGTCVDSNNDELFDAFLDHPAFRDLTEANLTLANFEMASPRVKCPAGYKKENKLLRCEEKFELTGDKEVVINLMQSGDYEEFKQDQYCVEFEQGTTDPIVRVHGVCTKEDDSARLKFYPYVLCLSAAFLLATVFVYTRYPKVMDSNLARLRRHLAVCMLLAFTTEIVRNFGAVTTDNNVACRVVAFLLQYFFLATFSFMTVICVDTSVTIITLNPSNNAKRYQRNVAIGYSVPMAITLLTLTLELSLDKCATGKPRFGEETCYFGDETAKLLWFHGPIALMLLINLVGCSLIIHKLCAKDRELGGLRPKLNIRDPKSRKPNMDKLLQYLKLFLGMGVTWIFEVLSGALDHRVPEEAWYVTDMMNMLQGVYIFWAFVCTRRILTIVLGRERVSLMERAGTRVYSSIWRVPPTPARKASQVSVSTVASRLGSTRSRASGQNVGFDLTMMQMNPDGQETDSDEIKVVI